MGEPVPGAEVYIELEPDDQPIANVTTDQNGEFSFTTNNIPNFPKNGKFIFIITPTKQFALKNKLTSNKEKVEVPFNTLKNVRTFNYKIILNSPGAKAQGKGSFAVSGKSAAFR
jgi:uncharacterized GH25 family protein